MDGQPSRLVEDEDLRVLVDDALGKPFEPILSGRGLRWRPHAHGRHADPIAGLQAVARARSAGVHANLPRADQAIDMAARNTLQLAQKIVIEPLPRSLGIDISMTHARRIGNGLLSRPVPGSV